MSVVVGSGKNKNRSRFHIFELRPKFPLFSITCGQIKKMNSTKSKKSIQVLLCDRNADKKASATAILTAQKVKPRALPRSSLVAQLGSVDDDAALFLPLIVECSDVEDALHVIREIRGQTHKTPVVIFLDTPASHHTSEILDAGADDVITASTPPEEFVSRIYAVKRRANSRLHAVVTLGDLEVDMNGGFPRVDGTPVALTAKESSILQLLAARNGRVVSRSTVYNSIYAFSDNPPFEKAIDVHIFNLRKKLDAAKKETGQRIKTIAGQGFTLK